MKSSFMRGAVILMAANAVSKILGAFLKIPLTYIINEEGMAIYNTAFSVYAMLLSFVVSGIPFAVTKLTAAEKARGNMGGAKATVIYATAVLAFIGMLGSAIMWLGADFFAAAMKEPRAAYAIRAVAPSVLLVALGEGAKSGFQGDNNMIPTAVSQCIEAVIKLAAGYLLAVGLVHTGTEMAAAGAIAGVTAGEIAATMMLMGGYCVVYRKIKMRSSCGKECVKDVMSTALPMVFMAAAGSALSVIDASVIRASLLRAGLGAEEARYLYGAYTGYAMTVLNLPSGFLATFGVSVIPIISQAAAVGDRERICRVSKKGLLICGAAGSMAAAFMAVCGEWVLGLLFKNTASALMLRTAAPSVAFVCIMQLSSAILQAMGCAGLTFISVLLTGAVKLFFGACFVCKPGVNIYGAAMGTDAAYFVGMLANILFLVITLRDKGLKREKKSDIMLVK